MNIELSKSDKRACRELIHIALERECKAYVQSVLKIAAVETSIEDPYREENGVAVEGPWHKRFIELFCQTDKFNEHIAEWYDGIGGSRYLITVLGLCRDGILSADDISILSEELRNQIDSLM